MYNRSKYLSIPTRISPLGSSAFLEFFPNFTELFFFRKGRGITVSENLRKNRGVPKKVFFAFGLFLTKLLVTGSPKFAQIISPVVPVPTNFVSNFLSNSKKYFFVFFVCLSKPICHRRRVGALGKAADSKIEVSCSNSTTDIFFTFLAQIFHFFGARILFLKKKLRIFL